MPSMIAFDATSENMGHEAEGAVQGHASTAAEHEFAGTLGVPHARPELPQLDLSDERFQNQIPEDPDSPTAPQSPVMDRYKDPKNLPPPYGPEGNPPMARYGRVTVPVHARAFYEWTRATMVAAGGKPKKYLVHLEQGPGPKVEVHPYISHPDYQLHVGGAPAAKKPGTAVRDFPLPGGGSEPRVYVTFPTNEARFTHSGGRQSALTTAAHELGHAAQAKQVQGPDGIDIPETPEARIQYGGWTNRNEHQIITKIERGMLPEGEMPRDNHGGAAFISQHFTSTTAENPQAEAIIQEAEPRLREATRQLMQRNVDATHPPTDDEGKAALDLRQSIVRSLIADLKPFKPSE